MQTKEQQRIWVENNREHARKLWRVNKAKHRALIPKKIRILKPKNPKRKYGDRAVYLRAYQRVYRLTHRQYSIEHESIRQRRERLADGRFTFKDIQTKLVGQKYQCVYCFISLADNYHIDHIKPLSKGGTHYPINIQLLCPTCNLKKGSKYPYSSPKHLTAH